MKTGDPDKIQRVIDRTKDLLQIATYALPLCARYIAHSWIAVEALPLSLRVLEGDCYVPPESRRFGGELVSKPFFRRHPALTLRSAFLSGVPA